MMMILVVAALVMEMVMAMAMVATTMLTILMMMVAMAVVATTTDDDGGGNGRHLELKHAGCGFLSFYLHVCVCYTRRERVCCRQRGRACSLQRVFREVPSKTSHGGKWHWKSSRFWNGWASSREGCVEASARFEELFPETSRTRETR